MFYRNSVLLSPADVGGSGTKIIDINFPEVISRLTIIFQAFNPGSITIQEVAAANIPKIEIVDGSNVLFSLTGMQTEALDHFDTGNKYICNGSFVPTWGLDAVMNINFGRFLGDPLLAFDPKKFVNPQLKITFDEDAAVASAITNELSVIADIFDEKAITPTGFLMNKELYSYIPVAGATEEIDLPSDYPYRKLVVQARVNDLWFGGIIANLKLTEDNDRKIPMDLDAVRLEKWLEKVNGYYGCAVLTDLNTATGVTCYYAPTQGIRMSPDVFCTGGMLDNVPFGYSNLLKTTTMTGVTPIDIRGMFPHGCLNVPFGNQQDVADAYDVKGKNLKLKLKAGSGKTFTETFRIFTQQIRSYAAA